MYILNTRISNHIYITTLLKTQYKSIVTEHCTAKEKIETEQTGIGKFVKKAKTYI